ISRTSPSVLRLARRTCETIRLRLFLLFINFSPTEQYGLDATQRLPRGGHMDIWPTVHAERKALADDLRDLGTEDWARPSLCGAWTARDVLAHMTSAAKLTPPAFFGRMIGSGFSFDKVQEKGVAANLGASG